MTAWHLSCVQAGLKSFYVVLAAAKSPWHARAERASLLARQPVPAHCICATASGSGILLLQAAGAHQEHAPARGSCSLLLQAPDAHQECAIYGCVWRTSQAPGLSSGDCKVNGASAEQRKAYGVFVAAWPAWSERRRGLEPSSETATPSLCSTARCVRLQHVPDSRPLQSLRPPPPSKTWAKL